MPNADEAQQTPPFEGVSKIESVALHMRVSSEEQKTKQSIGTQDDFLKSYCDLYGLEAAAVYKDEAVSGTVPVRNHPEGARLLADAEAGAFNTVLVYKLDRIGRSLLVVVDAHDRLGEAGVALRSATEPIDTSTAAGRLIFQMLAPSPRSSGPPSRSAAATACAGPSRRAGTSGAYPTATTWMRAAPS